MRSINFMGTGWESEKRIVPLVTLYGASTLECVRGDLVTDHLLGAGHGLADSPGNALQDRLHVFRMRRDVLVYGFEVGLGHHVSINFIANGFVAFKIARSGGADFNPQGRTAPRASEPPPSGAHPDDVTA
jgi:hypothetical protein